MQKYSASDDGKVVGGKIVVLLNPLREQQARSPDAPLSAETAPPTPKRAPAERAEAESPAQMGKLQAASLTDAARAGVPFCAECEEARRKLAAEDGEST
jgi:hypothetical protein